MSMHSPTDEDLAYGPNEHGELASGCKKCNVSYGSAPELRVHFATIHQRQTFECLVCNKLFLQRFCFLAHVDRFHPELRQNFNCQHCDRVYTTKSALDEHSVTHKNLMICPLCQKALPSKDLLKKHLQNVHDSGGIKMEQPSHELEDDGHGHPYQCPLCPKSYKTQSGLVFHTKSKHQDTDHKCSYCGKCFSRPSNVARHIETIHTMTKSFPCKWCGKEFRSTGGRDMHVHAEHKGVRFDCDICMKQFKRKGSLDRHMAGVHRQSSSVFKCSTCSKEFKQKSHLKTHMKNVHGLELQASQPATGGDQPVPAAMPQVPEAVPAQQPVLLRHSLFYQPQAAATFHQHNLPVFPQNVR